MIAKDIGDTFQVIILAEMAIKRATQANLNRAPTPYGGHLVPITVAAKKSTSHSVLEISPMNLFSTNFTPSLTRCPSVTFRTRNSARSPASVTMTGLS